ncbi:hypothetical protein CWI38_0799p0030 [Hamiltosporidium tvaerminnensis]|uniref:Uncharacterized protein n=1 Tax=Hamiltosporidium tvaerminnensis TaxID=1176355 RepID=A0A4Q9LUS6_9MICR|nr:hypothetical protein CWI38_0799p0030 [Hamiltosporidium tvaerminnensis]
MVVAESVPNSTDIVTFENEASGQGGAWCNRTLVCKNRIEYNIKMNACQSKELHEKESNNDCRIGIPETTKAELSPQKTESLTFSCNIIAEDVISINPFQKTNHINMLSHQRPSIAPNSNTERKISSDNCHASCGENKICDESCNGYWCEPCKLIKCCEDPDFVSGCTEGFCISIRIFLEVIFNTLDVVVVAI